MHFFYYLRMHFKKHRKMYKMHAFLAWVMFTRQILWKVRFVNRKIFELGNFQTGFALRVYMSKWSRWNEKSSRLCILWLLKNERSKARRCIASASLSLHMQWLITLLMYDFRAWEIEWGLEYNSEAQKSHDPRWWPFAKDILYNLFAEGNTLQILKSCPGIMSLVL